VKKRKKWIILGVIVLLVVGAVAMNLGKKEKVVTEVQADALKKTSLASTVSTTGVVQSTDSVNVYTALNYSVKNVRVKVGDQVQAGDLLCELDTKDLTDAIRQKETALRLSSAASAQKIKISEKKYQDAKKNLDAGLNAQINTAQSQVDSAKQQLQDAKQKQTVAQRKIKEDLNANLISANAAVESASVAVSRAQKNYDDAKKRKKESNYDDEDAMNAEIKRCRESLTDAQSSYDTAQKNLKATKAGADEELLQYQNAVDVAQASYDSAVKALKAVQTSVDQDLKDAQAGISADKLSADDTAAREELTSLRQKLTECTIIAPISGTITAVNVSKDAPAAGALFTIENIGALKLNVKIKEYDIPNVKVGMNAIVKADAMEGKEFTGTVQKIAPAPLKAAEGITTGNDAEYGCDILITAQNTGILIGMNGKADIILQKKEAVFAVPFDAVVTDAQGKNSVFTAVKQPDGTYHAQPVPVTIGIETDSEIEVSGTGLSEGLLIIADGKQVTSGQIISLGGTNSGAAGAEGTAQ
jgi:multidrug efflux pump subunit AcrA (membrane-fusion protein)